MDKKELQKVFKSTMKDLGYTVRGTKSYRYITDDYIVVVMLDHNPYSKSYFVEYGVIFEPDERYFPIGRWLDWDSRFKFSSDHDIANTTNYVDYYEYESGTIENFEQELIHNFNDRVTPVCNKEYVLDFYRKDWILFRMIPYETVHKIARLAGLNGDEVIQIRDSNVKKWP